MARTMNMVILNLSGNKTALITAVNMLAVAELYSWIKHFGYHQNNQKREKSLDKISYNRICDILITYSCVIFVTKLTFTTLSSFLSTAATTRPPTLLNSRPRNRKIWTFEEEADNWLRTTEGSVFGAEIKWTKEATNIPYKYNQNCCSRKFSPEF